MYQNTFMHAVIEPLKSGQVTASITTHYSK